MKMKLTKLFPILACLLIGLAALSTTSASAQGRSNSNGDQPQNDNRRAAIKERLQEIAKQLQLTDAQKEQLRPIFREEAQKVRQVRQDTTLTREQKRDQLKEIRQDLAAKVKPILTPEQLEKWKKIREERRAKHGAAK